MKLEYFPNIGFKLISKRFNWSESRESVRGKLNNQHNDDDRVIKMAEFFDGDTSHDIKQRRDIYQDINNEKNYFFLSYDKEDNLSELEIHWGIKILINSVELEFEKDIYNYLEQLESIGEKHSKIEEGNYFFQNLKMTIANSESTGGEGNGLSYFYSAKNVEHLIEN